MRIAQLCASLATCYRTVYANEQTSVDSKAMESYYTISAMYRSLWLGPAAVRCDLALSGVALANTLHSCRPTVKISLLLDEVKPGRIYDSSRK